MFDLTQPAPLLTSSAVSALQAVVVLLRATRGFMFLPLLVQSERAAAIGLDFLQSQVSAQFYTVSWPLEAGTEVTDQRLQLLVNLDEAIGKLPPDAVLVLNAAGSLRQDLALQVIAYINHRREPLRTANLRLVLCWPEALKNELLSNAPDLWSVRAASPWVDIVDVLTPLSQPSNHSLQPKQIFSLSATANEKLLRWKQYRDLKKANLSLRDLLDLCRYEYNQSHWDSLAGLAESVLYELDSQENLFDDKKLLVEALDLLAIARSKLGNFNSGLKAARKSVLVARQLALSNRLAYEPILATTITTLANRLNEIGDHIAALAASREAVEIRRRLTSTNPSAYEPDLALSINNLAVSLSSTGDRFGALVAVREALEIRRRLAILNPAIYEPDLAMSINNLATTLSETGDRPGALTAAREAVAIRRRLAQTNPAAYEPDLAGSINNLASFLSETGDRHGALTAAREAVDIYRRLAQTNPAAYEPDLAGSINNLANRLSETGDRPGALTAAREAVALYEKVDLQTPGAFDQQLAIAKRVLSGLESETN